MSPLLRDLATRAALVLAVVIVYHNALWASFFEEDYGWLVGSWSFHPHVYRPMIDMYFAVMTPLVRSSPILFHEASIALHIVNVLVVFALAQRVVGVGPYPFIAALFFAVQPLDIDAIAWVGALAEPVAALFGCLSLLWFLRWREDGQPRWRTLSTVAFILALLTHESSIVFLAVLFLAEWLLVRRNSRVPFAACWMLLALVPLVSFNGGDTSRYLYQPAIGFSLLLAEAVVALDRELAHRMATPRRGIAVGALAAIIAIPFAVFAAANVRDFTERSQVYSDYLGQFRAIHGTVPSNTMVIADPPTRLPYRFINAAVQWDYRDPTIRIAPYDSDDVR